MKWLEKSLLISFVKKVIIKIECKVHLFNNREAAKLLKKYGYHDEHKFYKRYMYAFNKGAIWADQNFKSSNHFYNPETKKGLFDRSHAMDLVEEYYFKALSALPLAQTSTAGVMLLFIKELYM